MIMNANGSEVGYGDCESVTTMSNFQSDEQMD